MATTLQEHEVLTEYRIVPVAVAEKPLYEIIKRVFDLIVSIVGMIVLLIPMVVLGILVRIDSKGPAIYKQERLGKDGKPFMLYKFRSMRLDAEAAGPQWAEEDDERCTKLGRVIRKCRVDELPQFINVIKGEMSLVGPRPERAYFYRQFEEYIPGFCNRLAVLPGITGWAQVNGGYTLGPEEKIVYDMEYIEKRSVAMDLYCLFKTVHVVLAREGSR